MNRTRYPVVLKLTDFSADVNLKTVTGGPFNSPPHKLEVVNLDSGVQSIVLRMLDGAECAFDVLPSSIRPIYDVPMGHIVASGTQNIASVNVYYEYFSQDKNP